MNTTNGLYKTGLTRRSFFKAAGLTTAAFLLPHFLTACGAAEQGGADANADAGTEAGAAGSAQETGYGTNSGAATTMTAATAVADPRRIETDVLVIGGGMAGAFAAIAAQAQGLAVTLVDKGTVGRSGSTPWANTFSVFDEDAGDDREE